jgi:hypothetical protein
MNYKKKYLLLSIFFIVSSESRVVGVGSSVNASKFQSQSSPLQSVAQAQSVVQIQGANQAQMLSQLQTLSRTQGITQQQLQNVNMMIASVTAVSDPNVLASFVPMITSLQQKIQQQAQQIAQQKALAPLKKSIIANLNQLLQVKGITGDQQKQVNQLLSQVQSAKSSKQINQYNSQSFALANQINQFTGAGQNNANDIATIKKTLQGISTKGLTSQQKQQIQMYTQQLSTLDQTNTSAITQLLQQVIAFSNTISKAVGTKSGQKIGLVELQNQVSQLMKLSGLTQDQQSQIKSLQSQVGSIKANDTKSITSLSQQASQMMQQFIQQNIGLTALNNQIRQLMQMGGLNQTQQSQIQVLQTEASNINGNDSNSINKLSQQATQMMQQFMQQNMSTSSVDGTSLLQNVKSQLNKLLQTKGLTQSQQDTINAALTKAQNIQPNDSQSINALMNQVFSLQSSIQSQIAKKQVSTATTNTAKSSILGKLIVVEDKQTLISVCNQISSLQQKSKSGLSKYVLVIANQPNHDSAWDTKFMSNVNAGLATIWKDLIKLGIPVVNVVLDSTDQSYKDFSLIRTAIEAVSNTAGKNGNDWMWFYPGGYLTTLSNLSLMGSSYSLIFSRPQVDNGSSNSTYLSSAALGQYILTNIKGVAPDLNK